MTTDLELVELDPTQPVWERFFTVAPLVVVGTREPNGEYDLAPKHMATPLGWDNYFGFVCTPSHATYTNVQREDAFTVSYPRPDQVVLASLTAAPRCDDGSKAVVSAIETLPAEEVDGVFVAASDLFLECRLERIVDGFGRNSLIAGKVVAARARPAALRDPDRDDQDLLAESPLLAYLPPGRFASVGRSLSFPFPEGFER